MAASATLDSLSSDQVRLALRTLAGHRRKLEVSHEDSKRLAESHTPPGYILDFDLLYTYMYEAEARPEKLVELEYLFGHRDITFVLGHGTRLELMYKIKILSGIDLSDDDLEEAIEGARATLDDVVEEHRHKRAIDRFLRLMNQENFVDIADLERRTEADAIDYPTLEGANLALRSVRSGPEAHYPNMADALNLANVVALRKTATEVEFFPFVLTGTRPILEERNWWRDEHAESWGFETRLSRDPRTAIYSSIVRELEPNPVGAADYTAQLIMSASVADLNLRLTRGYKGSVEPLEDAEWQALAAKSKPDMPSEELLLLSDVVSDPVITEAQRVYDNTQWAIANWQSDFSDAPESPRQLFDLIIELSRLFAEKGSRKGMLARTWDRAIKTAVSQMGGFELRRYLDTTKRPQSYLEAERHNGYRVLRWPAIPSAEKICAAFGDSLARHRIEQFVLHIGTTDGVQSFDAEPPVTLGEMSDRRDVKAPILWLRFDTEVFDLYADIVTDPKVSPIVGVLARHPDSDHLARLYAETSARFLFKPWLMMALEDSSFDTREK